VAQKTFSFDGASTLSDISNLRDALQAGTSGVPQLDLSDAVPQVVVFALAQLLIAAQQCGKLTAADIEAASAATPQLGAMFALTGLTGTAQSAAA
jgi:hypothetical protein